MPTKRTRGTVISRARSQREAIEVRITIGLSFGCILTIKNFYVKYNNCEESKRGVEVGVLQKRNSVKG
jgi:hypothetical protein